MKRKIRIQTASGLTGQNALYHLRTRFHCILKNGGVFGVLLSKGRTNL